MRIEGDAEGELCFYHASGERLGPSLEDAVMTPGGHALEAGLSAASATLLEVMGTRGGWHPDWLCRETGLGISELSGALCELELTGRVRTDVFGYQAVTPVMHP